MINVRLYDRLPVAGCPPTRPTAAPARPRRSSLDFNRAKAGRYRYWFGVSWAHETPTGCTGAQTSEANVSLIGGLAADVMAQAILRGVKEATSLPAYPAVRDLGRQ